MYGFRKTYSCTVRVENQEFSKSRAKPQIFTKQKYQRSNNKTKRRGILKKKSCKQRFSLKLRREHSHDMRNQRKANCKQMHFTQYQFCIFMYQLKTTQFNLYDQLYPFHSVCIYMMYTKCVCVCA